MARSIIAEVEAEYGEPFWDVVRGFAADNYGCNTTARILGYAASKSLRSLIKSHGVQIDFPKNGKCNVQLDRQPLSEETKKKLSAIKLASQVTKAKLYEQKTGESAEAMIDRLKTTHTVTQICRLLGYTKPAPFRSWMRNHGIVATFKKATRNPPRGVGLQSKRCRMVTNSTFARYQKPESAHHADQHTP